MAFSYVVKKRTVFGDLKVVIGTFTNASSSTGGDIVTGLKSVEVCLLQSKGSAVIASAPVCNETFPLASGTVTIVTTADECGMFVAYGH